MGKLSLQDWLEALDEPTENIIDFSFPTDELRDEYIATIEQRDWHEVIALLRKFLLPSCSLGSDATTLLGWKALVQAGYTLRQSELHRRLTIFENAKTLDLDVPPPWEGITWILDLLPDNPRAALNVVEGYFEAHCMSLPDGRLNGLFDAMEVIRAKYIERPRSQEDAIQVLVMESPRSFEHLVERLYAAMGYVTSLTPRQKDGGYDIAAAKQGAGQRARLHIECKKWEGNVGVPILRGILGVVSDSKATSGVCVTTSDLTGPAKTFVERNPRLDFVPGPRLVQMLNEYLGSNWYQKVERLVADSNREALMAPEKVAQG